MQDMWHEITDRAQTTSNFSVPLQQSSQFTNYIALPLRDEF